MNKLDTALSNLSEKELLVILIKAHADTQRRLKKIERMCDLLQEHVIPKNVKSYNSGADGLGICYTDTIKHAWDIESHFNTGELENEIEYAIQIANNQLRLTED